MRDDDGRHFADMAVSTPRERLSRMMSSLLCARHWTLERAMREWARTDDAVDDGRRELAGGADTGMDVARTAMV